MPYQINRFKYCNDLGWQSHIDILWISQLFMIGDFIWSRNYTIVEWSVPTEKKEEKNI